MCPADLTTSLPNCNALAPKVFGASFANSLASPLPPIFIAVRVVPRVALPIKLPLKKSAMKGKEVSIALVVSYPVEVLLATTLKAFT